MWASSACTLTEGHLHTPTQAISVLRWCCLTTAAGLSSAAPFLLMGCPLQAGPAFERDHGTKQVFVSKKCYFRKRLRGLELKSPPFEVIQNPPRLGLSMNTATSVPSEQKGRKNSGDWGSGRPTGRAGQHAGSDSEEGVCFNQSARLRVKDYL